MAKLTDRIGSRRDILIWGVVIIGAVLWLSGGSKDDPAKAEPAKAVAKAEQPKPAEAPLDVTKKAFTNEGAISCPAMIVLDNRVGHGLQDASRAVAGGITGPDEKTLQAIGCTMWHAGQPVTLGHEQKGDQMWLLSADGLTIYASSWLRN